MKNLFKKVLVLAPHTDDGELGCGGTMARMIEEGVELHCAAFSICEQSINPPYPKNILEIEWNNALDVLQVPEQNRHLFKYEVRKFPTFRQDILENLIWFRDNLKPDLVLQPSLTDLHQDHRTISEEGLRAFKQTTILGYEIPWNNINFTAGSFIYLKKSHIEKKVQAMSCYKSQSFRGYADPNFIFSLARTRGVQIEVEYAEVFEIIRLIIR